MIEHLKLTKVMAAPEVRICLMLRKTHKYQWCDPLTLTQEFSVMLL